MLINHLIDETKFNDDQISKFHEPGSCYLILVDYFSEAKYIKENNNTFQKWQEFVLKYFDINSNFSASFFENGKLSLELSNFN